MALYEKNHEMFFYVEDVYPIPPGPNRAGAINVRFTFRWSVKAGPMEYWTAVPGCYAFRSYPHSDIDWRFPKKGTLDLMHCSPDIKLMIKKILNHPKKGEAVIRLVRCPENWQEKYAKRTRERGPSTSASPEELLTEEMVAVP